LAAVADEAYEILILDPNLRVIASPLEMGWPGDVAVAALNPRSAAIGA
jgi:hypothetical protein